MSGVDRRSWLIISGREARALLRATEQAPFDAELAPPDAELERARVVMQRQLAWIGNPLYGEQPKRDAAVEREELTGDAA